MCSLCLISFAQLNIFNLYKLQQHTENNVQLVKTVM